jgi:hypothetical protein
LALAGCGEPDRPAELKIWHGAEQRVGHLGDAQDDFNLMGVLSGNEFGYSVNGGASIPLDVSFDRFGFRRLGEAGHFNADIPISSLKPGANLIEVFTKGSENEITKKVQLVRAEAGECALPLSIQWGEVDHIQDVGQAVDGRWVVEADGLRSKEPLYDRLFLFGNRTWTDYRITTTVTVHGVPDENGPKSGGSGLGMILRFAGHSVTPPRFPDAQPKWGYQPFGGICWLRWTKGAPAVDPTRQFYRGDRDEFQDGGPLSGFAIGETYGMTAECTTSPTDPSTTTYRLRVWPKDREEPEGWDFQVEQSSESALRAGGVALVAHHVDVTFGDVRITPAE